MANLPGLPAGSKALDIGSGTGSPASELRNLDAASGLTESGLLEGALVTATSFPPIAPNTLRFRLIMNRDWQLTRENMQKMAARDA